MSYFEDLTPYGYGLKIVKDNTPELNVGWLEKNKPYPIGETSQKFKDRLSIFCSKEFLVGLTKGVHECEFCSPEVVIEGTRLVVGNGEIRVIGKSAIYAAPELIFHYVVNHHYKPPDEFINAVLTGPQGGTKEHLALIWEHTYEGFASKRKKLDA